MIVWIVKVACVKTFAKSMKNSILVKVVILLKVKIGNKIYDSKDGPIMVILSSLDKENISNMGVSNLKYCSFPRGVYSQEEIEEFMELKEGE